MKPPAYTPPTSEELKKFGWIVGGIFLFLGAVFLVFFLFVNGKHPIKAGICLSIGGLLVLLASIPPLRNGGLMRGIHRAWVKLAIFLGKYVGHYVGIAVFALLFFVIFTPVSFIARVVGFDPLGVRRHRRADSYWHRRHGALTSDHYEKQFPMETPSNES